MSKNHQFKNKKKIIIVGAGPGGLSAAMLLAHQGHDVVVYEKQNRVGGRNAAITRDGFTFDLGPTFLMMPDVFEQVFAATGRKIADYLDLRLLDPMYSLHFSDGRCFPVYFDKDKMAAKVAEFFPGDEKAYSRYLKDQKIKYERMYPCLEVPYLHWYNYFNPALLKALPVMDIFSSLYGVLSRYFRHEEMKLAMTFQAKYLGMSPWDCPGPFSILSYVEHAFGVFHIMGGLNRLSAALAQVSQEEGAKIFLSQPVEEIIIRSGRAVGVRLGQGREELADVVIMNADLGQGLIDLIPERHRPRWSNKKLSGSPFSCSTFMIYLGLNDSFDLDHHNIFFAGDYRANVEDIFRHQRLSEDFSFYVQNASRLDPSLAPDGQSTFYILVPVPNADSGLNWAQKKQAYRDLVIKKLSQALKRPDLSEKIVTELVITPDDWQSQLDVYKGGVFNLAHILSQMLYLRPHNQFGGVRDLYLVGGGTHPGSGLPTIVESGRIAADLINKA